jgi:heme-degrading monooxygenase HmoA
METEFAARGSDGVSDAEFAGGDARRPTMIARLAEHGRLPADLDPEYVTRHRAFIAEQPGICGGYHPLEPATGGALSLTIWRDEQALAAAERAQRAPSGHADGRISRETDPSVRIVHVAAVF